jgi:hypothetical protein
MIKIDLSNNEEITSIDDEVVDSNPRDVSEYLRSYVAEANRLFEPLNPYPEGDTSVIPITNPGFDPATLGTKPAVDSITNAKFVFAVFETTLDGATAVVCSKAGDPTDASGWPPMAALNVNVQCQPGRNNYVNCATFRPDPDGTIKARKANFASYQVTVLDDIGTKVPFRDIAGLKPSWIIKTSRGNYQVGIIHDVPLQDLALIERFQKALKTRNLSDGDALNGSTRWVRLPVAVNGKAKHCDAAGAPFQCELVTWNPERRYSIEQIVKMLSIEAEFVASVNQLTPQFQRETADENSTEMLAMLLDFIDPNCGYRDWANALMAVHNETGGSDEGLDLVDAWSSGGTGYPGRSTMEAKWRSFRGGAANPLTIGTLIKMAKDAGDSDLEYIDALAKGFVPCEMEVIAPGKSREPVAPITPPPVVPIASAPVVPVAPATAVQAKRHPLEKFSLRGQSAELRKRSLGERPILGEIGIQGQLLVIYAAPNTGKTLITLSLLWESIQRGRINPDRLFYLNMDDNSTGLAEKSRIADDSGFHMLVDGYRGFKAHDLEALVRDMVTKGTIDGAVIVLDTMKKFVNVMDKKDCSRFSSAMRTFAMQGGTLIALAHVNKNPGADGQRVFAGTTDIVDDFDNAYMLTQVAVAEGVKTVEFKNIKRRGNNPERAGYSYSVERQARYEDVLLTVKEIDLMDLDPIKQAAALVADEVLIKMVEGRITAGVVKRMELIKGVSDLCGASRANVSGIVTRYTGGDPAMHRWNYKTGARGAHLFELLDRSAT